MYDPEWRGTTPLWPNWRTMHILKGYRDPTKLLDYRRPLTATCLRRQTLIRHDQLSGGA